MKKLVFGFAAGVALSAVVVLLAMCGGEEFQSTVLKYGVEDGTGIVATGRFVILFDEVSGDSAGSHSITYAGRHGSLPALWSGYSSGWTAGDNVISSYHTYDPNQGKALLFYFGKLIMVEDSGRFLRVQDGRFPLGDGVLVVSVKADGFCKSLTDEEAREVYETLDPWYKDGSISTRPLNIEADELTQTAAPAPQS